MKNYRDTETDEILNEEQLLIEYTALRAAGNTEAESFDQYLSNCLDKNGTLVRC